MTRAVLETLAVWLNNGIKRASQRRRLIALITLMLHYRKRVNALMSGAIAPAAGMIFYHLMFVEFAAICPIAADKRYRRFPRSLFATSSPLRSVTPQYCSICLPGMLPISECHRYAELALQPANVMTSPATRVSGCLRGKIWRSSQQWFKLQAARPG